MRNYIGLKAEGMGFNAHLTVLYTGHLDKDRTDAVEQILSELRPCTFIATRRTIDRFGPGKSVPVVTLWVPQTLYALRASLLHKGLPNLSEYEWNPHIALKLDHMKTIKIPYEIRLTALGFY